MRIVPISVLLGLFSIPTVFAGDLPEFLKQDVYTTDKKSCGDTDDADGLQLSKEGIFGQEFSCTFVRFDEDADPDTGQLFSVVATANCGDDSGITRPDMITLSPYAEEGQVMVQSQNEYILSEVEIMIALEFGNDVPEKSGHFWVSNTYNICK